MHVYYISSLPRHPKHTSIIKLIMRKLAFQPQSHPGSLAMQNLSVDQATQYNQVRCRDPRDHVGYVLHKYFPLSHLLDCLSLKKCTAHAALNFSIKSFSIFNVHVRLGLKTTSKEQVRRPKNASVISCCTQRTYLPCSRVWQKAESVDRYETKR